jgi:hypothetical protein
VDPTTIRDWTQFCREVMLEFVAASSQKLEGSGKIVEIEESCFGRRNYKCGRFRNVTWVFGGVERESRAYLIPLPDRSA